MQRCVHQSKQGLEMCLTEERACQSLGLSFLAWKRCSQVGKTTQPMPVPAVPTWSGSTTGTSDPLRKRTRLSCSIVSLLSPPCALQPITPGEFSFPSQLSYIISATHLHTHSHSLQSCGTRPPRKAYIRSAFWPRFAKIAYRVSDQFHHLHSV